MAGDNPYFRQDPNTAMPDIYRVKGQYLDSYYNFIDNSIDYHLKHRRRAFIKCQGAIMSLFLKLKWELSEQERKKIEKMDLNSFENLETAFDIFSKKLKQLKIIDLKFKPVLGGGFK